MRSPGHHEDGEERDEGVEGLNWEEEDTSPDPGDADREEVEGEDAGDDSDLNLLIAMAELEAEAAEAYRIAAEYTDEVNLRTRLEEFRNDHLRHVETINGLLSAVGGPEVSAELDEQSSALTLLAASMGTMGVRAALLAMIANEQLTNATYQAATMLPFEEDVALLMDDHLADEQRHLEWLSEQESRVHDAELDAGAGA